MPNNYAALKALDEIYGDPDDHKNWSDEDWANFRIVRDCLFETWQPDTPTTSQTCTNLGYRLSEELVAVPDAGVFNVWLEPRQSYVTAVRTLKDAWNFAADCGWAWEQIGPVPGTLERARAMDITRLWECRHELHEAGCHCESSEEVW